MYLRSLLLEGFRSYKRGSITFDPSLTTLVGENNVGKSTIGLAVQRIVSGGLGGEDYPYGVLTKTSIVSELELSVEEIERYIVEPFLHNVGVTIGSDASSLRELLTTQGPRITLRIDQPSQINQPLIQWGNLWFSGPMITGNQGLLQPGRSGSGTSFPVDLVASSGINALEQAAYLLPFYFHQFIATRVNEVLRRIIEFRTEAIPGQRTPSLETMTGVDTASVLLNLKNHAVRAERDRYHEITEAFARLFRRYRIEAIEAAPGTGNADIQFLEEGQDNPLSLSQVSAGVKQVLTLLTNLIGRQGLILFVEHPEQHLHPHGMRYLQSLLVEASERNQIIVITHDPHFVGRRTLQGLHRVWWSRTAGTQMYGLNQEDQHHSAREQEIQTNRIHTVFRQLGNREVVFARAVVLVEDESQQEFLLPVAEKLSYNLDEEGISILWVSGDQGYDQFIALLQALAIPFVCLKDKPWGNDRHYPPDRFFSLGMELEDYLDAHGLANERQAVISEFGKSKARVSGILGAKITKEQVPSIFNDVLTKANKLATGEPSAP